jgi:hypothetical protein
MAHDMGAFQPHLVHQHQDVIGHIIDRDGGGQGARRSPRAAMIVQDHPVPRGQRRKIDAQ